MIDVINISKYYHLCFLINFLFLSKSRLLCGRRVRVELSTGRSRNSFRGPPPRPFHPDDRCYDCGERGHYARDCKRVSKRYYNLFCFYNYKFLKHC